MSSENDYSNESIIRRQVTEPIYLTNGCCENAHGSPEVFESLGLPAGYWNSGLAKIEATSGPENDWYPLTPAESQFVWEDYSKGPFGGLLMSYSMLFNGRKWFAPSVEICFAENKVFSRESYGDSLYETEADAIAAANKFSGAIREQIEALGGKVYVHEAEDDRVTVSLMFPTDQIVGKFQKCEEWETHLNNILRPFNDLK
jgi:hypothetical protein